MVVWGFKAGADSVHVSSSLLFTSLLCTFPFMKLLLAFYSPSLHSYWTQQYDILLQAVSCPTSERLSLVICYEIIEGEQMLGKIVMHLY